MTLYIFAASSFLHDSRSAVTSTVRLPLPNCMDISSPSFTSVPGFAVLPFTVMCPCSQASLATVRRFIILEFFRNLSILILPSPVFVRRPVEKKSNGDVTLLITIYLLTASLRAFPALNTGAFEAAILITSPGFLGFLPCLAFLSRTSKVPKPIN